MVSVDSNSEQNGVRGVRVESSAESPRGARRLIPAYMRKLFGAVGAALGGGGGEDDRAGKEEKKEGSHWQTWLATVLLFIVWMVLLLLVGCYLGHARQQ